MPHPAEVLISKVWGKVQKMEVCGWSQQHYFNERKLESYFSTNSAGLQEDRDLICLVCWCVVRA